MSFLTEQTVRRRSLWISEIRKLSGDFVADSNRLETDLAEEFRTGGIPAICDHLRLCGAIPESYGHDSSEEKLYSKYTDALLSEAFKAVGIKSLVLKERADAADVECFAGDYSFVADAKAFRLSRTAKNQKDFKMQSMSSWKRGKPYAMVVGPLYQLPARSSQIYEQASARNVCLLSFSHLALILAFHALDQGPTGENIIKQVFTVVESLHPSKDATGYWQAVNRVILETSPAMGPLWIREKEAALDSVTAAKEEALTHLAGERERIMRMSHADALAELIAIHRIESRIQTIQRVRDTGILNIGQP